MLSRLWRIQKVTDDTFAQGKGCVQHPGSARWFVSSSQCRIPACSAAVCAHTLFLLSASLWVFDPLKVTVVQIVTKVLREWTQPSGIAGIMAVISLHSPAPGYLPKSGSCSSTHQKHFTRTVLHPFLNVLLVLKLFCFCLASGSVPSIRETGRVKYKELPTITGDFSDEELARKM